MNKKQLNIGIDIHGVADLYKELFKELSIKWHEDGHRIHIVTGQEWEDSVQQVEDYGIVYDEHFSIVDRHKQLGTEMYQRSDRKGWWVDPVAWNSSKGNYALSYGLDIHFDDQIEYAEYFPSFCTFILVPTTGFDEVCKKMFKW